MVSSYSPDLFSVLTQPPYVTVYICDADFICRNCTGGAEQITLLGDPGWNYVMCEEIGSAVKIVVDLPNLLDGFSVAICEVNMFGIDGLFILSI